MKYNHNYIIPVFLKSIIFVGGGEEGGGYAEDISTMK